MSVRLAREVLAVALVVVASSLVTVGCGASSHGAASAPAPRPSPNQALATPVGFPSPQPSASPGTPAPSPSPGTPAPSPSPGTPAPSPSPSPTGSSPVPSSVPVYNNQFPSPPPSSPDPNQSPLVIQVTNDGGANFDFTITTPDEQHVWTIVGDGTFLFNLNEVPSSATLSVVRVWGSDQSGNYPQYPDQTFTLGTDYTAASVGTYAVVALYHDQ